MNPEIITAFAAGVATAAAAGGLVAAWTSNKLIKSKRQGLQTDSAEPERDELTGLYTLDGFVNAVDQVRTAPTVQRQLLLIECAGLDEVSDTYGPEAVRFARSNLISAMRLMTKPSGLIGRTDNDRAFAVLADETACRFIDEGKLWVDVLDVATPDPDDDPFPEIRQFGRDYLHARTHLDEPIDDLEVFDQVRCEVRAAATEFEPGTDDVRQRLSVLETAIVRALGDGPRLVRLESSELEAVR